MHGNPECNSGIPDTQQRPTARGVASSPRELFQDARRDLGCRVPSVDAPHLNSLPTEPFHPFLALGVDEVHVLSTSRRCACEIAVPRS